MKTKIYKLLSRTKQGLFALALIVLWRTAYSQTTYTFNYTGSTQTISLPAGNYSIACWGADGGTVSANTAFPGKGGYSSGDIALSAPTIFTIYVGGRGNGGVQPLGGFNSGNGTTKTNVTTATGGGGASDVRVLVDDFFHRIIVAGGGGGQGTSTGTGGHGGGLTGQNGQGTTNAGIGGTQTAPGVYPGGGDVKPAAFGEGSDGPAGTTGGQGGGGWYGGSFGTRTNGGGAGGSGYVLTSSSFTPTGYFSANPSYYFTNTVTAMFGTTGFVTNPDVTGNGKVFITELCNISLTASGTNSLNPLICSGQSLTLTTNAVSNYSWSTGATTSSLVVAPTTNTVYSLSATSPSNCTASRSISVTVSSGPPVLSISNPSNNICLGKNVVLTASGAITYTWTNPGVVNGQTFAPSSTAVYTVTGQNGCGNATATTTITVAPLAVSILASPTIVCEGNTATLTASSSVTNYTWEPGTQSGSLIAVTPTANTIYTVSASDGTCAGTATIAINTKQTPTITTAAPVYTICQGTSVTINASGAGTGGTYSWSPGGSGASITLSPPSSTAVSVLGTNSLNCTAMAQAIIIVDAAPPLTVVANKTLVCIQSSVILTAAGAGSYAWTGGPTTAVYSVTPTAAVTIYTVVGSHSTNTCTTTRTITVTALIPNVSVNSTVSICDGAVATLTASGANNYVWNGVNTGTLGNYQTNPQVTSVYTLVATTSSLNVSCPKTFTILAIVNANPVVTVTAVRPGICTGETNTLTATGASTYSWETVSGSSGVVVVTPTATSIFTVTGYDANGCENTTYITAKVSTCLGISERSGANGLISVYPNPSGGEITIQVDSDIKLRLVNSLGQELQSFNLTAHNNHKVNVRELPDGIYFIMGENENGKINEKIIVAK